MMSVRAFLCVAIRTKSLKKGVAIVSVGAGLVQVINDNDNRIAPKKGCHFGAYPKLSMAIHYDKAYKTTWK